MSSKKTDPNISELRKLCIDISYIGADATKGMFDKYFERVQKYVTQYGNSCRKDEVKKATVGRVTSERNRNQKTYMSGFGYAANNLQDHKTRRLAELTTKEQR